MKKLLWVLPLLLGSAWAQFTTVSGTVTDPNGLAYANGSITALLVSSASPVFTATNLPYAPPTQPVGLNSAGSFVMQLADVTTLTPGGSTWTFTVSCAAGCVPVSGGKGPLSFTVSGITISGASQSITATLNAAALALTVSSSGGTPPWSAISAATANQTLNNTTFNTTISNSSSTNFIKHSNVTPATSLGVNPSSPTFNECGNYFFSGVSTQDCWNFQDVITAGTVSATVTNVSENASNVVTLTITGGTLLAGQQATFTGLTTATWLNSQNAFLTTASATSLTFTDPTSHGTLGSSAETGQVTQANPLSAFTVAHVGSGNGPSQTMFQSGEATFGNPTPVTYPTMNIGQLSVPGRICSTTGAGNYGTGFPNYGFAMHDICPTLFTAPAPIVTGTSSRSIMGLNSGIATAFPDNFNVFAINGQLATPSSYTGNQWSWYGMYHESDHNGSGALHTSYSVFGAGYNSGNGSCLVCVGGHFEAVGNFYGNAVTPTTTQNTGLECNSGARSGATHTNDYCFRVLTPFTGGTFTNGHIGIQIDDQTNAGVIAYGSEYAIRVGAGGSTPSGQLDWGANTQFVESTGTGFLSLAAPTGTFGSVQMHWPTATGTLIATGQSAQLKTVRFGASCTTAAAAQATCTSTFSWTTAFANANYTPVCWGEGPSGSPILTLNATQVAASITVQVQNAAAAASSFAGVYCHAISD